MLMSWYLSDEMICRMINVSIVTPFQFFLFIKLRNNIPINVYIYILTTTDDTSSARTAHTAEWRTFAIWNILPQSSEPTHSTNFNSKALYTSLFPLFISFGLVSSMVFWYSRYVCLCSLAFIENLYIWFSLDTAGNVDNLCMLHSITF